MKVAYLICLWMPNLLRSVPYYLFLQLTTFLQFRLASWILPQSPYLFHLYFCLDVVLTTMNSARFLIAWRNWNVVIYTAKRCCLILKAFSTVQYSIFCYDYIHSTSLHVLYAIYKSRKSSEQSCQRSMIFEEGGAKPLEFQSPLTKRVWFSSRHGRSRTLRIHGRTLNSAVRQIAKR